MDLLRKKKKDPEGKKRLIFLSLAIFSLFSILVYEFYKIQLIEGEKWARVAQAQHFFFVEEPFLRGTFYAHAAKAKHPPQVEPFVVDIQKFHLYADPLSIPDSLKAIVASSLSDLLTQSPPINGEEPFLSQLKRRSRSRKLAMWLDLDTKEKVQRWWLSFAKKHKIARNALYFMSDYQRSYPYGKLLGQVLHTVQQTSDASKQAIPTGGLELYFNSYLKGHAGRRRLMRSPKNALEMGQIFEKPLNGADIYLTINPYLQAIAEEEIELAVKRTKAKGGYSVMINPYSGEILALAQYPFFDPTRYRDYFNDPLAIEHTKLKAAIDVFEPGSIMKPITLAVALMANQQLRLKGEKELFSPQEKIATANGRFPGRSKPIEDTRSHLFLNMDLALQKSSNIYMARLMERVVNTLGNDWYRQSLADSFGLGQKTGLELPAESSGMLPTPGKKYRSGALEWSLPTPFSLAIGHNLQVTALQMLRAYSVIANGGYLVTPTLVRQIVRLDERGERQLLLDHTLKSRQESFPKVLDKEIVDRVTEAMKYVTKTGGAGTRGDVPGFTEAGKTGTSRKIVGGKYSTKKHVASFIGFAPAKEPAFVLLVVIDEPEVVYIPGVGPNNHGGVAAAPAFREIAKRSLDYLGVPSDDPYGHPLGDPRYDPSRADWLREAKKLKEIYESWNRQK